MVRIGSIIILFISVIMMIKMISETWESRHLPKPPETAAPQKPADEGIVEDIQFNPPVPPTMPDLKTGYLFNESRLIKDKEEEAPTEPVEENLTSTDVGITTNVKEVTYSGAIITDIFKRAIITYSPGAEQPSKTNQKSRSKRKKAPKRRTSSLQNTQLSEGDLISGYKVTLISPEKIVFAKGDDIVEKHIYDPDKKRAKPVRSVAPRAKTNAPPRPRQVGGTPAPTSSLQRQQASEAPTTNTNRTIVGGTRTVTPPVRKPIIPRSTQTRRLVVSRKPPPKPDTSRVSRRRRASTPTEIPSGMPSRIPGGPPMVQ